MSSKNRNRNGAHKVSILYYVSYYRVHFFRSSSALDKIFEKAGHQTGTRGRPAPKAEVALLFLAGNAGHQTRHQKSASTQTRGAPRQPRAPTLTRAHRDARRRRRRRTGLKSSNPTHGGLGTTKLGHMKLLSPRRLTRVRNSSS